MLKCFALGGRALLPHKTSQRVDFTEKPNSTGTVPAGPDSPPEQKWTTSLRALYNNTTSAFGEQTFYFITNLPAFIPIHCTCYIGQQVLFLIPKTPLVQSRPKPRALFLLPSGLKKRHNLRAKAFLEAIPCSSGVFSSRSTKDALI